MKAAFIRETGPPEGVVYSDLPAPVLSANQCLILVQAVSVNPIDTYLRAGLVPMKLPLPYIVGCDLAGTVKETGPEVKQFNAGDRVWGSNQGLLGRQGTFAELAAVDAHWLYPTPPNVSDEAAAACALVGITAHLGLVRDAKLRPGETLFVNGGSGGVGSMVVQMAKILGAHVIATAGSDEKAAFCRQLGADVVINYKTEAVDAAIKAAAPNGVNVWWETLREPDFDRAVAALAPRGRMIVMAGREARPPFPVGPFYVKGCALHGFAMFYATPDEQRRCAEDINRWLADGRLKPCIDRVLPLERAAEAHRLQEENTLHKKGTLAGKIVLEAVNVRRSLVTALVMIVLGLLLWKPLRLDEPWYHWKSLTAWLDEYGAGPDGYKTSPPADEALRHIGSRAIPYLLKLLQETNSPSTLKLVRRSAPQKALTALQGWGRAPMPTRPWATNATIQTPLTKLLAKYTPFELHRITSPASWQHWKAFVAFQALGASGKPAIPELAKLAHLDPSGTSIIPSVGGMRDVERLAKSSNVSFVPGEIAAWSLAVTVADGVPPLVELLADPSPRLKQRAAIALGLLGAAAEPAVPALVKELKHAAFEVRQRTADALGEIGRQPDLAIPALIVAIQDTGYCVGFYAAEALGRFGGRATNAIPALLEGMASGPYLVKESAAIALSRISRETTANQVIPVLLRDLKDSRSNFRNTALITLSQIRDQPDLVIPAIIVALDDGDKMVRGNAIRMLGRLGPQARAAVPKLVSLENDSDPEVRKEAASALQQIQSQTSAGAAAK